MTLMHLRNMQRSRGDAFEGTECNIQVDLERLVTNYIDLLLREGDLLHCSFTVKTF